MNTYYDVPAVSERNFADPNFESWFRAELTKRAAANRERYNLLVQQDNQLMALVRAVYGYNSAPYKYMYRQEVPRPPDLERRAKKIWKKYWTWVEVQQRRAYGKDYRRRSKEANQKLQEQGFEPGTDYIPTRAISFSRRLERESTERSAE